jgi:hypothetical protein
MPKHINLSPSVIASEARQSRVSPRGSEWLRHQKKPWAPRNDGRGGACSIKPKSNLWALILGAAYVWALIGCAPIAKAGPIFVVKANTPELYEKAGLARWRITLHSGRGIPGSPGAEDFIPNAFEVAQKVAHDCKLGKAIYAMGTDGVSTLSIANRNLSKKQIACMRAAERTGFYVYDYGAQK